ncbi:MAG: hypothetical protein ACREKH_17790, partial [Candidatus Rokuibacteriota bacterium]
MRRLARVAIAVLVSALAPAMAGPASALDLNQWVPGLRVIPFLAERVEYQTNVFGTRSDPQGDLVFRTSPGAVVEWVRGENSASVGYRTEILNFLEFSELDRTHHILAGQLQLDFNRLRLYVRDDFLKTSDPQNTELTGRVDSSTNAFVSEAVYRLGESFLIGANAGWTTVSYPDFPQLDRHEYLAGGSVFWRFTPKADLQLGYNHGEKIFDDAFSFRDVSRDIVFGSVRGDVTAKLSSTFRLGWERRQPKRSGLKSYSGLVAGGDWTYRPTERLTIALY